MAILALQDFCISGMKYLELSNIKLTDYYTVYSQYQYHDMIGCYGTYVQQLQAWQKLKIKTFTPILVYLQ